MSNLKNKALVLGSTGLVGSALLEQLQTSAFFDAITVIVRHKNDALNDIPRVEQYVLDDFLLLNDEDLSGYTHVFSCLGTTLKKAGSKQKFYAVDYEINAHVADLLQNQQTHFLFISALGANVSSMFFYNRVKGELEEYIKSLGLYRVSIFQPSLLIGMRDEQRLLEGLGQRAFTVFEHLVKKLFLYKPVHADEVAKAMLTASKQQIQPLQIYDNLQIQTMT
ncbi:NAD-dependent epimerase/dehydratase family protein [Acinetobacter soli]|uniref:NAD-dependent epimerase/dehydratase family protein n=1 Tax=Acinetobacter soli TaxID=487316 RepID=UPI000B4D772C|nr:NAD-dependent epimerase/dehydratase family protein [Acinetobacter soli]